LHGIPGFVGGIASIIATGVAAAQRETYGAQYDTMFTNGTHQWGYQFATLAITIGIAILSALGAGLIIRWFFPENTVFFDEPYWEIAAETMLVHEKKDMTPEERKEFELHELHA